MSEPAEFLGEGADEGPGDGEGGGVFAEGGGDGVEGGERKVGFVADGVDGFPGLGLELGAEGFEAAEVVEAVAVCAGPMEHAAEPEGIFGGDFLAVLGESDEAEGGVGAIQIREGAHGGIDEQLGSAIGGIVDAHDLFEEIAGALGDGGSDEEANGLFLAHGDPQQAVAQHAVEDVGLGHEMQGWEMAMGEPIGEANAEIGVVATHLGGPIDDPHAFIFGAI